MLNAKPEHTKLRADKEEPQDRKSNNDGMGSSDVEPQMDSTESKWAELLKDINSSKAIMSGTDREGPKHDTP